MSNRYILTISDYYNGDILYQSVLGSEREAKAAAAAWLISHYGDTLAGDLEQVYDEYLVGLYGGARGPRAVIQEVGTQPGRPQMLD